MRNTNLDISFDEFTQPAKADLRADMTSALWRSVRILLCMLGLVVLSFVQLRSSEPPTFFLMTLDSLLFAMALRLVGADRGYLRKRHIHALLEVEHMLVLAGIAPWDMDGFKRRVQQFASVHRRILLAESLYFPLLMLFCGMVYLAGSLLDLDYDVTVLPMVSIIAIAVALMVGVLIRESKRLRLLTRQVHADPAQIAV